MKRTQIMKSVDRMLKQRTALYDSLTASAASLITATVLPALAIEMNLSPDTMVCSGVLGYGRDNYLITVTVVMPFGDAEENKYIQYAMGVVGEDMSDYDDPHEVVNFEIQIPIKRTTVDLEDIELSLAIKEVVTTHFTEVTAQPSTPEPPKDPSVLTPDQEFMAECMHQQYGRTVQ